MGHMVHTHHDSMLERVVAEISLVAAWCYNFVGQGINYDCPYRYLVWVWTWSWNINTQYYYLKNYTCNKNETNSRQYICSVGKLVHWGPTLCSEDLNYYFCISWINVQNDKWLILAVFVPLNGASLAGSGTWNLPPSWQIHPFKKYHPVCLFYRAIVVPVLSSTCILKRHKSNRRK